MQPRTCCSWCQAGEPLLMLLSKSDEAIFFVMCIYSHELHTVRELACCKAASAPIVHRHEVIAVKDMRAGMLR